MTNTPGAITQAIEAMETVKCICTTRAKYVHKCQSCIKKEKALEALRTFKDEMPRTLYAQAKHLQEGIK